MKPNFSLLKCSRIDEIYWIMWKPSCKLVKRNSQKMYYFNEIYYLLIPIIFLVLMRSMLQHPKKSVCAPHQLLENSNTYREKNQYPIEGFKPSIETPLCRETPVSRTEDARSIPVWISFVVSTEKQFGINDTMGIIRTIFL